MIRFRNSPARKSKQLLNLSGVTLLVFPIETKKDEVKVDSKETPIWTVKYLNTRLFDKYKKLYFIVSILLHQVLYFLI